MAERVVVPLEAVDVDDADAAPADALLDRQERLDPLHEPVEIQELRLRIAVRLLGQAGDDLFEVAGDVADGDVLLGQLALQPRHLFREPFRHRADGFVLRLFEQLTLIADHGLDRFGRAAPPARSSSDSRSPHPLAQIGRVRGICRRQPPSRTVRWEKLGHRHLRWALHQGMCRERQLR